MDRPHLGRRSRVPGAAARVITAGDGRTISRPLGWNRYLGRIAPAGSRRRSRSGHAGRAGMQSADESAGRRRSPLPSNDRPSPSPQVRAHIAGAYLCDAHHRGRVPPTTADPCTSPSPRAQATRAGPTRTSSVPSPGAVVLLDGAGHPRHRVDLPARRRVVRPHPRRPAARPPRPRRATSPWPRSSPTASTTSPHCTATPATSPTRAARRRPLRCCAAAGRVRRLPGPRRRVRRARPPRSAAGRDRPGRAHGAGGLHRRPRRPRARLAGVRRRRSPASSTTCGPGATGRAATGSRRTTPPPPSTP